MRKVVGLGWVWFSFVCFGFVARLAAAPFGDNRALAGTSVSFAIITLATASELLAFEVLEFREERRLWR